jgi:hypothetical protein
MAAFFEQNIRISLFWVTKFNKIIILSKNQKGLLEKGLNPQKMARFDAGKADINV